MIKFFQPINDIIATRSKYPIINDKEGNKAKSYFNSSLKYQFSIHKYETADSHFCIFIKGSP